MKSKDMIMQNKVFFWLAGITGIILLIPLIAMQFIPEVNWNLFDFIVMGILLFGAGSVFVMISRKINKKYRIFAAICVSLAFLYLWAELAVGIFTNWGS